MIKRNSLKKQKLIESKDVDAYWAHVLWQRHGLRIEDYEKMTEAQKAFYIASERYEDEHPCRKDGYMFRTAVKGGK